MLHDIQLLLEQGHKCLSDFSLSEPFINFNNLNEIPRIIAEEMNYDLCELHKRYEQGYLNAIEDQRIIFNAVVCSGISKQQIILYR